MIEVWNFGNTRKLPYRGEYIEIPRRGCILTDDPDMAKALEQFPFIETREALEAMSMRELNKLAGEKGVFEIGLKKAELIKRIKEVT